RKDTNKSATIEWLRPFYVPKYERFEIRRSRLRVHNPPCIDAQVGQSVLVARTRSLSKTKNHVILQITKEEIQPVAVDVITGEAVGVMNVGAMDVGAMKEVKEAGAEKSAHSKEQKVPASKRLKVKSAGEEGEGDIEG
ncbi:MAG: 30S ribosomal protein S17, partial [Nanoarchaeota archaeon]